MLNQTLGVGTGVETDGLEREAARMRDDKRYFTGRPCIHGHVAERYTKSGNCLECIRIGRDRNRSVKDKTEYALMMGKLTKRQAIMWHSPWYCEGFGQPCGHAHWLRVIDDQCKMCLDNVNAALDLLS